MEITNSDEFLITRNGESLQIRSMRHDDIPRLVEIHMEAFKDHRSVRLGAAYVRAGHEWFVSQTDTINLVACNKERVLGFVEGAPDDYSSRIASAVNPIGIRSLLSRPWLLLDSNFRYAIGRRLHGFSRRTAEIYDKSLLPGSPFVLVSIAVESKARGLGIAGLMMQAFESEVRRRQYSCLRLSVYRTNVSAAQAYRKAGWVKIQTTDPIGDYYWKSIIESPQEPGRLSKERN